MLEGIWSVFSAIQRYALEYRQLQTSIFVHHPWTYLEERNHRLPDHLHNWDKNDIGMINPCVLKRSPTFIDLVKSCPQYDFLEYKSWGFDNEIGKRMKELLNMG